MQLGPLPSLPVLIVNSSPDESGEMNTLLGRIGLQPQFTSTCQKALGLIHHHTFPVVLSSDTLPDGDWKTLLQALEGTPEHPELIVFSRQAEESLWYEVLQLGGFDVLAAPFDEAELVRVITLAHTFWQRKHRGAGRAHRVMRAAS